MKIGKILSVKKTTTTHAAISPAASQSTTISEAKPSPTPSPASKVVEFTEKDFKKTPLPASNIIDYAGIPEADAVITAPAVVTPIQAKKQRKAKEKAVKSAKSKPKKTTPTKDEKVQMTKEPIQRPASFNLIDYTDKSIALFGDTKPIKAKLVALGGRFNPALRPWGGETRVPGWIFPIKARTELQTLLAAI